MLRILAITAVLGVTSATAQDGGTDAGAPAPAPDRVAAAVAAGQHVRLDTDHGPVHVWVPAGYHPDGAATIVYVHGYYTDLDHAWVNYQLPEQFALSGLNAVFIACEAPSGAHPPVNWDSLSDLVSTVYADTAITRPMGPVIAMGHSGAFRTMVPWLDDPLLDTIVLVDSDYDQSSEYEAWLARSPHHRMLEVTEDTVRWSEEMARDTGALVLDRVPVDDRDWPDEARTARALLVRAQWGHMDLMMGGIVIPSLLRLLPVEILADAPWDVPLGQLPPLTQKLK